MKKSIILVAMFATLSAQAGNTVCDAQMSQSLNALTNPTKAQLSSVKVLGTHFAAKNEALSELSAKIEAQFNKIKKQSDTKANNGAEGLGLIAESVGKLKAYAETGEEIAAEMKINNKCLVRIEAILKAAK